MAIDTNVVGNKDWGISMAIEPVVGYPDATSSLNATREATELELDSFSLPTVGDIKNIDAKRTTSVGRIINSGDLFTVKRGAVHEVSLSGVYLTKELASMIVELNFGITEKGKSADIDGDTSAGTANYITIDTGHDPGSIGFGDAANGAVVGSGGAPIAKAGSCTIYFNGSTVGADINTSFRAIGCILTSCTYSGDVDDDGGRIKVDMTFTSRSIWDLTGAQPTTTVIGGAAITAYTSNYLTMEDSLTECKFANIDPLMKSFSMTVDNPVSFFGRISRPTAGTSGSLPEKAGEVGVYPEIIKRGFPQLSVTGTCSLKLDENTDSFIAGSRANTVYASGFRLSDNATITSSAAGVFAVEVSNIIITEASISEGDYLSMDVSWKMVDSGSSSQLVMRATYS